MMIVCSNRGSVGECIQCNGFILFLVLCFDQRLRSSLNLSWKSDVFHLVSGLGQTGWLWLCSHTCHRPDSWPRRHLSDAIKLYRSDLTPGQCRPKPVPWHPSFFGNQEIPHSAMLFGKRLAFLFWASSNHFHVFDTCTIFWFENLSFGAEHFSFLISSIMKMVRFRSNPPRIWISSDHLVTEVGKQIYKYIFIRDERIFDGRFILDIVGN